MIKTTNLTSRIRTAHCLYSEEPERDVKCIFCPDNSCCQTRRPKLTALIENSKKSDGTYEFAPEDRSILKEKHPQALVFNTTEPYGSSYIETDGKRIRVVECLSQQKVQQDENCEECRDKGCCLTVNPELASIVEKSRKDDGTYQFTQEDRELIGNKYLRAIEFDGDSFNYDYKSMWETLLEHGFFSLGKNMSLISETTFFKIEDGEYTHDELELIFMGFVQKWDKMVELYYEK